MGPDIIDARVSDFISAMEKRDFMTTSHAMSQEFKDKLSMLSTGDVWGTAYEASSSMVSTSWIDDLIEETKPTIKHLGRPKAKS